MPKVRALGASMLRGNSTNFYIRCDDDLDDIDVHAARGVLEYPHIHVRTDGPGPYNDILYIGITFGGQRQDIAIYSDDAYQCNFVQAVAAIQQHCRLISAERVRPLTRYFFGLNPQVYHQ